MKILDFGLARPVGAEEMHLTGTGVVIGTPAYMAPEQARGQKVDHRADLFSLGSVLYQMAGGGLPFKGGDTFAILTSLAVDTPADPRELNSDIPPELSALILHLLAKNPDDRPASANEVLARLHGMLTPTDSATTQVVASTPAPTTKVIAPASVTKQYDPTPVNTNVRPAPARRGRRVGFLLVAVGLLALIGVGILFGGQIYRIATNQGALAIEVLDPNVVVKIVQNGLVVQDKTSKREFTLTAGKGEIEVLEKDGIKLATKQFELTRGGKTTVKVTLEELADARKPKDPDRSAAEWVLSIGGAIDIKEDGKFRRINTVRDLPGGTFELAVLHLRDNPAVTDAGLAHFKDCKMLFNVYLDGTNVSDAGMAHFKKSKQLGDLSLTSLLHFP